MYWNTTSLTKMGSIVRQTLKGSRHEVLESVRGRGLDIISIHFDYHQYVRHLFGQGRLSSAVLSCFFKDFSRCLKSGLSAQESIESLDDHTANTLLKETLRKIHRAILDGYSFQHAFESTRAFPSVVISSMDAAEKSGYLPEVACILSEYFKFLAGNKIRVLKSLVYPASVFLALTAASIVISVKLVPQLTSILPGRVTGTWSSRLVIGYASFMQSYWGVLLSGLIAVIAGFIKFWNYKARQITAYILRIPVLGDLIKDLELTNIFLNLYVYQKSGMNIVAALTHIHSHQSRFMADRTQAIRDRVIRGHTLSEALKADPFFPSFAAMNVHKGEVTGNLSQYFYEIYQYYDQKSRDAIDTLITYINPALLTAAVSYLGLIIYCFILPLYSSMSGTGNGFGRY